MSKDVSNHLVNFESGVRRSLSRVLLLTAFTVVAVLVFFMDALAHPGVAQISRMDFPVGDTPIGVAFDGVNIWVVNARSNNVSVLRASDGYHVMTPTVGVLPYSIAFDGVNMWVTNYDSNSVTVLRASDGYNVMTIPVGTNPTGIAFDGTNIWVSHRREASVRVLGVSDGYLIMTLPVSAYPGLMAFGDANMWVAIEGDNGSAHTVSVFRTIDGYRVMTPTVGASPHDIAFDGVNMWVVNNWSNTVSVLRASDGYNIMTRSVGSFPWGIAFDGTNMWVTNYASNDVTVLRASDGALVQTVPVGTTPYGIAFDGANMWVANATSNTVSKLRISTDTTPPVITSIITGTLGTNGWYTSNVTISWSVNDPESGIVSSTGCGTTTLTADTAGSTLTCSATNGVGLSSSKSVTIKIDKTVPTISGSRTPAPNGNGWNNTDVTVNFTCSDALSGIDSCGPSPQVVNTEGAGQFRTGTAKDKAGNTASATVSNINIDKTKPTITIASPSANKEYTHTLMVNVAWTATDALSGIATESATLDGKPVMKGQPIDLFFLSLGSHTLVVNATDKAGNANTASVSFTVKADVNSLSEALDRALALGWITKSGTADSLRSKLDAIKDAIARGQFNAAKSQLDAFLNELDAQKGKAINQQAYDLLKADALYLRSTLP